MLPSLTCSELLQAVAEPTRLRILNCLAAAPLFVSDLQEVLGLPQPTVSRHLQVLRRMEVVRDTPISPFVLYRLRHDLAWIDRLVVAVLEAATEDETLRSERARAAARSRSHLSARLLVDEPDLATTTPCPRAT